MTRAKKDEIVEGAVVSSWRGYKRYACTTCAFDSLELEKFQEHQRNCTTCNPLVAPSDPAFKEASAPAGETFVQE